MLAKARGSCFEVRTRLEISHHLEFLCDDEWRSPATDGAEIGKLLNGLMASVRADVSRIRDDDDFAGIPPVVEGDDTDNATDEESDDEP